MALSNNWFYDWSTIVKNDAHVVVEVRQYNSLSIPSTIPWKIYDPLTPIPFLMAPTGSTQLGHWSFMATHPTASVVDLTGNGGNLTNVKTTVETGGLGISRRAFYPVLGGGTTGYQLTSAVGAHTPTTTFSWETYIYGMDASTTATSLSFIHTGSAGQGYAIEFDFVGQEVRFSVGSASITGVVSASIAPYLAESGSPANFHYVGGSFVQDSGLFIYIDGELKNFATYAGGVLSGSVALSVRHGESLVVDEFSLWSGFLDEITAAERYTSTKERLRYLGMPSGSYMPYHQARFTVYASGSQEFELHSFSIRGLQSTSASIFDPRITDFYSLPIFTSGSISGV